MIFEYEETKNKKLIVKILTDRYTYYKVHGVPYHPGDRIHIGLYNYLIKYKGELLGLLQVDRFSDNCALIHGCALPKFCKPKLLKAGGKDIIELFRTYSKFNKIIAPIPDEARHAKIFIKSIGFKEEARITDGVIYKDTIQDYIFYSYTLDRETK